MSQPGNDLVTQLGQTPLLRDLPATRLAQLATSTRLQNYVRGESIFQQGDDPSGLFVIVAGQVKTACQSPDGGEKVIEILDEHQTCGEAALFLECPYPFFAAALAESLLLHIDKSAVHNLVAHEPLFVRRMLSALSARVHTIVSDFEACTIHNPVGRIAGYLTALAGSRTGADILVNLPTAKTVIASRLCMTPEALSRALRDLSDSGLIEVRGQQVVLRDPERLGEFVA